MRYDLVLRGGRVVDGTGTAPFPADVAIRGGRITAIGQLPDGTAERVIDVDGRFLLPGLVDAHVHAEAVLTRPDVQLAMLRQGITTVVLGQDGLSFAPASAATVRAVARYFAAVAGTPPPEWNNGVTVDGLLSYLHRRTPLNVAYLIPLGTVRHDVVGPERRPARDDLPLMVRRVEEGLDHGAVGVSTGLEYVPGAFADIDELIALCGPAARFGAPYVSHLRSYADGEAPGMPEALEITRRAGLPLHVSHYRGRAERLLAHLEGADVTFDSYPHLYANTILAMKALPADIQDGGVDATLHRLRDTRVRERLSRDWFPTVEADLSGTIFGYVASSDYEWLSGLTIAEAAARGKVPYEQLICDVLVATNLVVNCVVPSSQPTNHGAGGTTPGDDDVRALARDPRHMGCSDGIYLGPHPHPRGWGAFGQFLGRFTREHGDWTWGTAAKHLSGAAAERFALAERGILAEGNVADIAVIDPSTVGDLATYDEPRRVAEGVSHVVVAGELALADGELTGATPGRALRRGEASL